MASPYVSALSTTELFDRAFNQAQLVKRAQHLPANKVSFYDDLCGAIVTYHATANSVAITKGILEAAATPAAAKTSVDALV